MIDKGCDYCLSPDGFCVFPYYGLAVHSHDLSRTGSIIGSTVIAPKSEWPENFREDPESPGCGTYTHCPRCGAPDTHPASASPAENTKENHLP